MKCYSHTNTEAISLCPGCNQAMCAACADRFATPICEPCLLENNKQVETQAYMGLGITAAIAIGWVIFLMGSIPASSGAFLMLSLQGLMFSFTYWGWLFLSERLPRLGWAILPVWFIYFAIKLMLAAFIGIFVGPRQIYQLIKQLRIVRETKQQLAAQAQI